MVEQLIYSLVTLFLEDSNFVLEVAPQSFLFHRLYIERPLVLVLTLTGKYLNVDDSSVDSRRACQRSVLNVAGLFTEDGPQQFLFRGELRLALRRDLADKDRAGPFLGADADDAALVEIAKHVLADVRYVTRDLLGA